MLTLGGPGASLRQARRIPPAGQADAAGLHTRAGKWVNISCAMIRRRAAGGALAWLDPSAPDRKATMAGIAPSGTTQPGPTAKRGERRAAGIYGAIVTAALLAAVGGRLPTDALVVSVVVTLLVYWVAEEYAEILAEQTEGGVLPTWASIRGALAATWPMVSASFAPLLALLLARLAGASASRGRQRRAGGRDCAAGDPRLVGGPLVAAARLAAPPGHRRGRGTGTGDDRAQRPGSHPPALSSTRTSREVRRCDALARPGGSGRTPAPNRLRPVRRVRR